jgi:hypothetical protein
VTERFFERESRAARGEHDAFIEDAGTWGPRRGGEA